ncbi:MAG: sugar phosphate isomerase/epimerase family protein [Planctomycetota bacterium]|jgi:sugar phosphate isomerase/epimerase
MMGVDMRLGGPVFEKRDGPDEWAVAVGRLDYGAAYCPVDESADDATVRAYEKAAADAGIVIAEVGAWSNPLSPDEATAKAAREKCTAKLALADRIGARCCVNVAGSREERWAGPSALDLTDEAFGMIVELVRGFVDEVKPTRTYYTVEAMPWMYPDSPDSYVRLIEAVDRERFAVHLDPANWISSPQRFFGNANLIRESFAKLGKWIRSCHAKDVALGRELPVHLDEVRPGEGGLDYGAFLRELAKLPADTPLMLEHLKTAEEYAAAAEHIRSVARKEVIEIG